HPSPRLARAAKRIPSDAAVYTSILGTPVLWNAVETSPHGMVRALVGPAPKSITRSEEHTSELQSRRDLVCRLLLEKKKKTDQPQKGYRCVELDNKTGNIYIHHSDQHNSQMSTA